MTALDTIRVHVTHDGRSSATAEQPDPSKLPGMVASAVDEWMSAQGIQGIGAAADSLADIRERDPLDFTVDVTVDPAATAGITQGVGRSDEPFESHVQAVLWKVVGDDGAEFNVKAEQVPSPSA